MRKPPVAKRRAFGALGRISFAQTVGYLSLFSFIVIIATLAIYAVSNRQQLNEQLQSEVFSSTFYLAEHASRLFEATNLALDSAIREIEGKSWSEISASRDIWSSFKALKDRFPYIDGIWFNDAEGRLRLTTFGFPAPESNASDRDFFKAHLHPNADIFVSELIVGRVTGAMTFLLSRRLNNPDGSFRGIASATVDVDYFGDFYRTITLHKGSIITMFRAADLGVVAQHPKSSPKDMRLPNDHEMLRVALSANPSAAVFLSHTPDQRDLLTGYRKIQGLPLFISVSVPLDDVEQTWWSDLLESAALALAAMLALAGLTWVAFRNARLEQQLTANLEEQVSARTAEIATANTHLATMFQEVHHRVKNNLQVVTSLLRLQMGRVDDPELKAGLLQSINRVQAMSLVHQLLYSTHEITDVDFVVYLERLSAQFLDAHGAASRVKIDIEGTGARYGLNTAIPLALIVNELLSNAIKHAFPSDRGGRITITVARRGGASEMTVCDDGPGFPDGQDWRRSKGLGLQIVRSLASQIGGTVEMTSDSGTCFVVTWPDEAERASA